MKIRVFLLPAFFIFNIVAGLYLSNGYFLLALGTICNFSALAFNDWKMPVVTLEKIYAVNHITYNPSKHRIKWLCDWIHLPKTELYLSLGDLALFAGLIWIWTNAFLLIWVD